MGGVGWVEIPAEDPEASGAFYEAVFRWDIDRDGPFEGYLMYRDGGIGGAFTAQWRPVSDPGVMLYIEVDDIEGALSRIEAEGGRTVDGKTLITEDIGWWASFQDPAGNRVGLFQGP